MAVFILILGIIFFSVLFRKREEHWLPFGKDHILRKFKQGGRTFIYEQASFGLRKKPCITSSSWCTNSPSAKVFRSTNTTYTTFRITSFVMKKQP